MKTANVVEVRDLGPPASENSTAMDQDPDRVDRMAELLRRYPAIAEGERSELLAFLQHGRQFEIGMVSAREGIAPRMAQFRNDHRAEFRPGPLQILGFILLVMGPLVALAWACVS